MGLDMHLLAAAFPAAVQASLAYGLRCNVCRGRPVDPMPWWAVRSIRGMNKLPVRAVAFDLDGTLVDSVPDIAHALNQALQGAGLPGFGLQQVRAWIGDGPDLLIDRALAALRRDGLTLRRALRRAFDQATLDAPLAHGAVYDGIAALLQQLQTSLPLVVVTNKPSALACAVLETAGLLPHFAAVLGADTAAMRKPAPALLHSAAARLGLGAEQLLMVGDSAADMGCAHAAGAAAVWVSWGYGSAHALPRPPRWRIDHPRQLAALLAAAAGRG
jgi:phosphoglycolate phosphatase